MSCEVLFFDLAGISGYAAGGLRGVQAWGTFELPKTNDNIGAYLNHADRCIDKLVTRFNPVLLGFEAPWINPKRDNIIRVRKLSGLANVAEQVADRHGITCMEATVDDVSRHFCGRSYPRRRAEKKLACRQKCRELGFDIMGDDDADAIAGLSYLLACKHPDSAISVSPLFRSA